LTCSEPSAHAARRVARDGPKPGRQAHRAGSRKPITCWSGCAGFDFHPLSIEDDQQFDQRPGLEEYLDHLFLVTQGFSCPSEHLSKLALHELHAFLGANYL
jgi:hypothetical protein